MINTEQRRIIGLISLELMTAGLLVDHWIEIDALGTAYLVYSVKGNIVNPTELVEQVKATINSSALKDEISNIYASPSKGRGRPKKSGEPPAEGLVIKCVLH